MKKYIFYILFLFPFIGTTQNLVPNPSFEILSSCPTDQGQLDHAVPWFSPTYFGTLPMSDIDNICAPQMPIGLSGIPYNGAGYQYPRTGNGYSGIAVFADYEQGREYISVKLDSTLKIGKTYCIGFYLSLSNYDTTIQQNGGSTYAIDRMGAYLSDTAINLNTYFIIPVVPQIENPTGYFLSDTLNWMLVSGTYTAHGGEQYITIGNFYANDSTNFIKVTGSHSRLTYYYIDDVYVGRCDTVQPPSENEIIISNAFTPNGDEVNDIFKAHGQNIKSISGKIFNRWGQELFKWNDVNSGWNGKYNNRYVSSGAYFYIITVEFENGEMQTKTGSIELIR